jgi:glycerol kinase
MTTRDYVLALDQGTTSTRAIVFDRDGNAVASGQAEHRQIFPQPGWVEHDPMEIWTNTVQVVAIALTRARITHLQLAAVGITNQRETTVVWDRETGEPVHNAIVWQDTRTTDLCRRLAGDAGADRWKGITGLPLATYFAGPKISWILDHVDGARAAAEAGRLLAGTIDSWLIWQLTGGPHGGLHLSDVTNASRTLLMDLRTLAWDESIAAEMGVPVGMLPEIRSSVGEFGEVRSTGLLTGVPITGVLGDQQAATFGQACFTPGMAKNTYGTGCFLLSNTGTEVVESDSGLVSTVCYRIGDEPAVYALEGSIAVAGSLVQWLRDNLGLISSAPEVSELARTVKDNGGAYIVPAFSGLFAPYWRDDARGVIAGLTRYVTKGHLARAALEASAYQTRDVVEAIQSDAGTAITELRVDGGMTANDLLMQFQADQLGIEVVRPKVIETTALGAAYAAGIGVGFWSGTDDVTANWSQDARWAAQMPVDERDRLYRNWQKAVHRTLDWVDEDTR